MLAKNKAKISITHPTAAAIPNVMNVAAFIAFGVISPSVTPLRNPARPFLSIPFLKS